MAKKAKAPPASDGPWRTDWPTTDDLNEWLRYMFEKAQAIDDPSERASQSMLPMELLAQRGSAEEALRGIERVAADPAVTKDPLAVLRLLESAAEICADVLDDADRAEQFLDRILARQPQFTRPSSKGFTRKQVEKFKVFRGLIDPQQVTDPSERPEAAFTAACRRAATATKRGDDPAARTALADADEYVFDAAAPEWQQRFRARRLVRAHVQRGDAVAARHILDRLPERTRRDVLQFANVERIGGREEVVAAHECDLREAMAKLQGGGDPNVHFVGFAIERALRRLVELGETQRAKTWLARVLEEGRSWELSGFGFASAGLFRTLAKITAKLESPAVAAGLLGLAETAGKDVKQADWRAGAANELLELHMSLGNTDEALRLAKKMRSPAAKRVALTRMLAKARRWPELVEVLRGAQTPLEACELCWKVRFAIDPDWKD